MNLLLDSIEPTRYLFLRVCVLVLLIVTAGCSVGEKKTPNVLFILVDDLGWTDLGVYGSEFYDTPNIDRFAGEAVRFTDAYSAHPVCSPTRAALLTGRDPVRINITDWIPGRPLDEIDNPKLIPPEDIHNLPLEEHTLAERFKEEGYATLYAGKWHLGEKEEYWPEHQGFDQNMGGHNMGQPPGGYYSPYDNPRLTDGPEGEYLTDRLTDETLNFIEQKQKEGTPFFAYLSYYTVHTPIQGAAAFDSLYLSKKNNLPDSGTVLTKVEHSGKTRLNQSNYRYAAMVRSLDTNVGRIVQKLKEWEVLDNTIVVFTSDNGGLTTLKEYGPTSVRPLRAGKGWAYEGGVRVPLMIKAPGQPEDETSRQPVISMDLYPTLLDLAEIPPQTDIVLDGISIAPYLKNPSQVDERTFVWHYPHYHGSEWRPGSAIRQGNWKLIEFYESGKLELYNLNTDVSEQQNVIDDHPDLARELRNTMHQYIDERGGRYPE
mgnify:FL=1